MSESIKWREMTPEQRDECIHEKVMGESVEACESPDDDEISISCSHCGHAYPEEDNYYSDPYEIPGILYAQMPHNYPVPSYTTSMDAAWKVVEKMTARMGYQNMGFSWRGPIFKPEHHYLTNEGYPMGTTCWYVIVETREEGQEWTCAEKAEDAICIAALRACGSEVIM